MKIQRTLFERLADSDEQDQRQVLTVYQQDIQHDLEELLNTRFRILTVDPHLKHTQQSLLNYGLPDLSTINVTDANSRAIFCRQMQEAIQHYEPRLKSIVVTFKEQLHKNQQTIQFKIEAQLTFAEHISITLDSALEPLSRKVHLEENQYGG